MQMVLKSFLELQLRASLGASIASAAVDAVHSVALRWTYFRFSGLRGSAAGTWPDGSEYIEELLLTGLMTPLLAGVTSIRPVRETRSGVISLFRSSC